MDLTEHIDVLKEWPFKVSYPKGGSLYLLGWWTDWGRGHALAASSEERIEFMLRHVFLKEGPGVKLLDYRYAEIVSPPLELRQDYSTGRMLGDLDQFRWYVGALFGQAQSKDHPVKKEATRCKDYRDLWSEDDAERARSAEKDKGHSQCRNCFGGWRPKNHTVESLYLLRRHEPRRYPGQPYIKPNDSRVASYPEFVESEAPEADPKRALFALAQNFGNHSDGLRVDTIERDEHGKWPFGERFHCAPITFFFHGEKLGIPKHFLALGKTARANQMRDEAAKKKAQKDQHRSNAEEANDILLRLFAP